MTREKMEAELRRLEAYRRDLESWLAAHPDGSINPEGRRDRITALTDCLIAIDRMAGALDDLQGTKCDD